MIAGWWGVQMRLIRHLRKSIYGAISWRAAVMCAAALSMAIARGAPPDFPNLHPSVAVRTLANQNHRQLFDHENFQWGTSVSTALPAPLPTAAAHSMPADAVIFEIDRAGWHFNRPPPII